MRSSPCVLVLFCIKYLFALLPAAAPALLPTAALAQTAPATDSAAATVTMPANPFTVYGFVDAYYGYDFRHAAGSLNFDYLPNSHVAARVEGRPSNAVHDFLTDRNPIKSYGNLNSSIALSF